VIKKIGILIDKQDKKNLIILFLLLLLSTFIEMVGLSSIPLFVITIIDQEKLFNFIPELTNLNFIKSLDSKNITLYASVFILSIFVIKNAYIAFVNYFNGLVIKRLRTKIYNDMFYYYIKSNYEFHITRNSADLVRNITSEVSKSVSFILSIILIIKEFLIAFTIFLMLLIVDVKISFLIFFLLGLFSIIFFFVSRRGTKYRGKIIQEYWGKQIKTLNHGLGSIKETKILNKENFIFNIFKENTSVIERYNFIQGFIVTLPRLFLELMAILVIVIVSISFILSDRSFENFLPLLALITACAVRMIPSFNTISSSIATMRHFMPSIDLVADELIKVKNSSQQINNVNKYKSMDKRVYFNKSLEVKNVVYAYPGTSKKILDNVSFKISHKEIVGIVGESGVGKSTLIDLISGLLKPNEGEIIVDDLNIEENLFNWQKQIGYVPQDIYLLDDSIKANIAFGVNEKDINQESYKEALKLAQLENFINSLPKKDNTFVGDRGIRLSGGQRQRIGIARSLYFNPKVLIFDEPTSALDKANEQKIMDEVYSLSNDITVIIISHKISILKRCNKILSLADGNIKQE
tara:strand:- start:2065 stop:3798 length:1734 start_codon:yes stop_codon:yes gene_type:complete